MISDQWILSYINLLANFIDSFGHDCAVHQHCHAVITFADEG